jgi:Domain of unknown function (DUF5655)
MPTRKKTLRAAKARPKARNPRAPRKRALWECPKCAQTFITANTWHSCVRIPVDAHFEGKPAALREIFDAFVAATERYGAVTLRPVKSRIALQAFSRFASVTVRNNDLACHVILDHGDARPRIRRVEKVGTSYIHAFTLSRVADVNGEIRKLLEEAQQIDRRRHGD